MLFSVHNDQLMCSKRGNVKYKRRKRRLRLELIPYKVFGYPPRVYVDVRIILIFRTRYETYTKMQKDKANCNGAGLPVWIKH